jgi:quinol monooxygenase YgiN
MTPHPLLVSLRAQLADPLQPFTMLIPIRISVEHLERFLGEAQAAATGSLTEPGCLAYEFHQTVADPGAFILFERWEAFSRLEHHFTLPHTHRILAVLEEIGLEASPAQILVPVTRG